MGQTKVCPIFIKDRKAGKSSYFSNRNETMRGSLPYPVHGSLDRKLKKIVDAGISLTLTNREEPLPPLDITNLHPKSQATAHIG